MVKSTDSLDQVFRALSDQTRRTIVERLSRSKEQLSAGQLAEPFNISLPAISKHLKYLEDCGLIERTKKGRTNLFKASRGPVDEANWWLAEQLHFWNE